MLYEGKVEIREEGKGSKSEGRYAHLMSDDKDYILYRDNTLVVNDTFFEPFEGRQVRVIGQAQERVHYLQVDNIEITND